MDLKSLIREVFSAATAEPQEMCGGMYVRKYNAPNFVKHHNG